MESSSSCHRRNTSPEKNGTRGSIAVARKFEHDGTPCTQYRLRIEVSGYEPFASTPVMCNAGGEWKLVNQKS